MSGHISQAFVNKLTSVTTCAKFVESLVKTKNISAEFLILTLLYIYICISYSWRKILVGSVNMQKFVCMLTHMHIVILLTQMHINQMHIVDSNVYKSNAYCSVTNCEMSPASEHFPETCLLRVA